MIFQVQNGSFGYHHKNILNQISFEVTDGNVLAVLGPNGVGKTTLLKCMMGFLPWKQGASLLDGQNIATIAPKELWQRIAYVPQAKNSAFSYTALEMVLLGRSAHLSLFNQPKKEDEQRALAAMEEVGVSHLAAKQCSQMSGGELQMVLIARALVTEPQMLVLDEPESNLDFKNQLIILETISRLAKERHLSAVVNTHYPEHALQISQQALILNRDGQSFCGPSDAIISEDNMRRAFGVKVQINRFIVDGKPYKSVVPLAVV